MTVDTLLNTQTLIEKSLTGIEGFDEIAYGGLPKNRSTLVCGSPGCGKTIFGTYFLWHGIRSLQEPGVLIAFNEVEEELIKNAAPLGMDLKKCIEEKKLAIDNFELEHVVSSDDGTYNLDGLFARIGGAIQSVQAKRICIDGLDTLFAYFKDHAMIRQEFQRLVTWLREKNITAIVTAEKGEMSLSRHGLEEYIADCVILLDRPMMDNISTRRLQIIKYRGSCHETSAYPFLINEQGISLLPLTSLELSYPISDEKFLFGIEGLDALFNNEGIYKGSCILLSGTTGTGKTSFASAIVDSACRRGERCLYFSFDESASQVKRNMQSIGFNLEQWVHKKQLEFHMNLPFHFGLEEHLLFIMGICKRFHPNLVVIDPISNLPVMGTPMEVKNIFCKMINFFKKNGITGVFLDLILSAAPPHLDIVSLMDTWINLQLWRTEDKKIYRTIDVVKSRGSKHSDSFKKFEMTGKGLIVEK